MCGPSKINDRLALNRFADSMVPLHGYRSHADLQATNEFWIGVREGRRWARHLSGPGLWFNRETGRIHIAWLTLARRFGRQGLPRRNR